MAEITEKEETQACGLREAQRQESKEKRGVAEEEAEVREQMFKWSCYSFVV